MNIACLGDSNTQAGWPTPDRIRWVEYSAQAAPQHTWRNYGAGGGTVVYPGLVWPWAMPQLTAALADGAELVLAAFGTNDVTLFPRDQIVQGYCDLQMAAHPIPVVVCTTPQRPGFQAKVDRLNNRLRRLAQTDGWLLLDFDSGSLVDALEPDQVHVTDDAQRERAIRATIAVGDLVP